MLGPFLLADEAQLGTSERPGIGRNHAGHGHARNVLRPPPASAMKPTAACARSSAVMPASHDLGHCCRTQQTPAARLGQRRWSADPMPHWRRCSLYLIAQTKKTRDRLAPRLLSPERIEPMPVVDLRMSSTQPLSLALAPPSRGLFLWTAPCAEIRAAPANCFQCPLTAAAAKLGKSKKKIGWPH